MVEQHVFDEVAQASRSIVPPELGELHTRAHRYGIEVWLAFELPARLTDDRAGTAPDELSVSARRA